MEREIKFRAWDKVKKRWVYLNLTERGGFQSEGLNISNAADLSDWQQFTGIFDHTGKKIYEGDIFGYWGNTVWVVVWDEKRMAFRFGRPENWTTITFSPASIKGKKVIGNIYENPELLK